MSHERSHLTPQVITDKNGVQRTVYVNPEAPQASTALPTTALLNTPTTSPEAHATSVITAHMDMQDFLDALYEEGTVTFNLSDIQHQDLEYHEEIEALSFVQAIEKISGEPVIAEVSEMDMYDERFNGDVDTNLEVKIGEWSIPFRLNATSHDTFGALDPIQSVIANHNTLYFNAEDTIYNLDFLRSAMAAENAFEKEFGFPISDVTASMNPEAADDEYLPFNKDLLSDQAHSVFLDEGNALKVNHEPGNDLNIGDVQELDLNDFDTLQELDLGITGIKQRLDEDNFGEKHFTIEFQRGQFQGFRLPIIVHDDFQSSAFDDDGALSAGYIEDLISAAQYFSDEAPRPVDFNYARELTGRLASFDGVVAKAVEVDNLTTLADWLNEY